MKEFFNKPTTRALIDTVVFFLVILGLPALFIKIMEWAGIDPFTGIVSTVLFIAMITVYNNRLEKHQDSSSTESDENQPLNS